ncbi:glycosyltransferase family 2 protein [Streptomyces ipomoeae]|uniref:Glycosyltransferase, group 2 family protein n=1 Tax=Streptomyces ipomoeae 91-03 TaxID=698759 RepID=L1KMV2_9ACTN|nr:glycosyltransferase family 2 protein [Streptomyces ipomoeae]EKX62146.1 glycosyltransferase, group 2 family protein [Streptomyces ipomoeae 91-03]MDX2694624.1 glycosyltransferase family 2 protein [Streptomyces ipomoeae]MDX2822193.1 glycosyltransferase family 2 protein [Streptomyces ipomoeae]MDX2840518.1 glycosyltransferase family 2 protein [Streptomyces ipomoeae]MDX2874118.1 glycosyltransferase family 2 protein [Streptomyces ipomoeae]
MNSGSHESTVPEELGDPAVRGAEVPEPGAVTIVVPTFNESANVRELLHQITETVPSRLPCEVVFVDDSTDDTPEVINEAAQDCPFPVTVLHRDKPVGGLGGAVVEGMKAAGSDWIVVMDGDLQHPPSLVPELVATGERSSAGLVVASRYIKGGSRAGLAGSYRVAVSRGATWLTKSLFPRRLHGISDPMSGFFAIRRSAVTAEVLQPLGYKILLELAVRSRPRQVTEVPFVFQDRFAGESKSTAQEGLRFLRHLVGLRTASPLARMIVFGLIGVTGFIPNLAGLWTLTHVLGMHYVPAEILANQLGVLWNFFLIEHLCFRERRKHRKGWDRVGRFALLANADLVLRIPLIALFVAQFGMGALPATALALVTTFVLRFVGTEALVYLPRTKPRRGERGEQQRAGQAGRSRRPDQAGQAGQADEAEPTEPTEPTERGSHAAEEAA